ncbi:MAG: hypothetical protein ACTSVF_05755 [Candidatus Asgardarchaeia archaeon]
MSSGGIVLPGIDELRKKTLEEIEFCLKEMRTIKIVKIYDTMSNSSIFQLSEVLLSAVLVYCLSYIYPVNVFLLSRSLPIMSLMVGASLFLIPINIIISLLYRRKVLGILKSHKIPYYVSKLSEMEMKEFCEEIGATLESYRGYSEDKVFEFFDFDYNYLLYGPRDESMKVNVDGLGEFNVSFLRNSYGLQGRFIVLEKVLDFPMVEFSASLSEDGLEVTCTDDSVKEGVETLIKDFLNLKLLNGLSSSNTFHMRVVEKEGYPSFIFMVEDYVPIGETDYSKLKEVLLSIINSLKSLYSP